MFKLVVILVLLTAVYSCSTGNQTTRVTLNSVSRFDSAIKDRDRNVYSVKILRDNKLWMTTNLLTNIPGSHCYNDSTNYCDQYGRLYTWDMAQEGCELLGVGWRLPTSGEWQQLTLLYGDNPNDLAASRKNAYPTLLLNGKSGFNAVLGGGGYPGREEYRRMEAHGFYWTSTADSSTAWFANFAKGSQALYMQTDGEKERAFSVRCVKSIEGLK